MKDEDALIALESLINRADIVSNEWEEMNPFAFDHQAFRIAVLLDISFELYESGAAVLVEYPIIGDYYSTRKTVSIPLMLSSVPSDKFAAVRRAIMVAVHDIAKGQR